MPKQKSFLLIALFISLSLSVPASVPCSYFPHKPVPAAVSNARLMQMRLYANLSIKDYEKFRGKKINMVERFLFKTSHHRMKKMLKSYDRDGAVTTLQKISWLLKGIVLGPIALLLGYLLLKGEDRELIKWIWFGFADWAIILASF